MEFADVSWNVQPDKLPAGSDKDDLTPCKQRTSSSTAEERERSESKVRRREKRVAIVVVIERGGGVEVRA